MSDETRAINQPLAFEVDEYRERIDRALQAMRAAELDALLLFSQESMYYLYGYDQIGYWVYQTVIVPADGGDPVGIGRAADEHLMRESPFLREVRTWLDDSDRDPGWLTVQVLHERGLLSGRRRIGIEKKSHALLAHYYDLLRAHLPATAELVDASDLVTELRLVKSPSEVAYVRRAAGILDYCFTAAFEALVPGAAAGIRECDVHAEVMHAMYSAGGEFPSTPPPIASGPRTLAQTHGAATERAVQDGEPFTVEIGAAYRRYHAVGVHSKWIGTPPAEMVAFHDALRAGLDAGFELLRPGVPAAEVARRVQAALEARGVSRKGRHVGYGTGIGYPPSWLDNFRLKETDPHLLQPNMTFFYFVGAIPERGDVCLYLGEPILITEGGFERLSALRHSLALE